MCTPRRLHVARSATAALFVAVCGVAVAAPPERPAAPFKIDANVALSAFASLSDSHLQDVAHSLEALATSEQARSADWKRIEHGMAALAKSMHAPALHWFALPDGSYWSVQNGREKGNLSARDYFPKTLAGQVVLGDLVVSKATGKSVAIVAVPVKSAAGKVVAVLGASVYLDKLSERIRDEMSLTGDLIFYSFDAAPILALVWDPGLIFTAPKQLGPEVEKAFAEMLSKTEGVVQYDFRDKRRTVVFRKSSVTGWWYALGQVHTPATAGL